MYVECTVKNILHDCHVIIIMTYRFVEFFVHISHDITWWMDQITWSKDFYLPALYGLFWSVIYFKTFVRAIENTMVTQLTQNTKYLLLLCFCSFLAVEFSRLKIWRSVQPTDLYCYTDVNGNVLKFVYTETK